MVAEYHTRLPDKKLLQAKLHEFYQLAELQASASAEQSKDVNGFLTHDLRLGIFPDITVDVLSCLVR